MKLADYRIESGKNFSLKDFDPADDAGLKKEEVQTLLTAENLKKMFQLQERLYAENQYALLIVLQAMDAAGKDGVIKHVFTGLNPQGTFVTAFKQPSSEELDHDYLWRISKALPRRGEIGIFNRSHYEEVIVSRVHNLVKKQQIPQELVTDDIWKKRYAQIRQFEQYLAENGIITIKLFLNLSKEEQRERLLSRIEETDKNWKFSSADIEERNYWQHYQDAYQHMIENTSTEYAPWYVIPADRKWLTRYLASEAIVHALEKINPQYPTLPEEQKQKLEECRQILLKNK